MAHAVPDLPAVISSPVTGGRDAAKLSGPSSFASSRSTRPGPAGDLDLRTDRIEWAFISPRYAGHRAESVKTPDVSPPSASRPGDREEFS